MVVGCIVCSTETLNKWGFLTDCGRVNCPYRNLKNEHLMKGVAEFVINRNHGRLARLIACVTLPALATA